MKVNEVQAGTKDKSSPAAYQLYSWFPGAVFNRCLADAPGSSKMIPSIFPEGSTANSPSRSTKQFSPPPKRNQGRIYPGTPPAPRVRRLRRRPQPCSTPMKSIRAVLRTTLRLRRLPSRPAGSSLPPVRPKQQNYKKLRPLIRGPQGLKRRAGSIPHEI